MLAKSRFHGADPLSGRDLRDTIGEDGAQPRDDPVGGRPAQAVTGKEGVTECNRRGGVEPLGAKAFAEAARIRERLSSSLIAREIDVLKVEQGGLTPLLSGLRVMRFEDLLARGAGPDTRPQNGLDAVDEPALHDGVAAVHAELDRALYEIGFARLRFALEETHVQHEALAHDGVHLVEPQREGLLEPERVVHDLPFDGGGLRLARRATHLLAVGREPLFDLAAPDFDDRLRGFRAASRLEREEQASDEQKMEQRGTEQAGSSGDRRRGRREGWIRPLGGYRNPMTASRPDDSADTSGANRALIDRYFEMVTSGDPEVASLFGEDVVWWTPPSSPMAGPFEGKEAVLGLMAGGVGLYHPDHPLDVCQEASAASGEHVFVQMTMRARTGQDAAYENRYVFVFRIQGGRIVEVHEHLDTLYAQRLLFDPVGQRSPLER